MLEHQLARAQTTFANAKSELERLRDEVAAAKCPFSVGDQILLRDKGNDYSGIVDTITAAPLWVEMPHCGHVDWIARGRRISVTTGLLIKWRFEIAGDQSVKEDGRWRHRTLNEALGIADEEAPEEEEN